MLLNVLPIWEFLVEDGGGEGGGRVYPSHIITSL